MPREHDTRQGVTPEAPAPPAPAAEEQHAAPEDAAAAEEQPAAAEAAAAADGAAAPGGAPAPDDATADDALSADDAASEAAVETDIAQLIERAAKAEEYLALAQRTQADFENFRKRMTRDVRAAEARGVGRLAKELLPALDNLDRAIAAVEASDDDRDEHHLTEGIRLVQSELSSALARTGIEGYASKGERFDPVHHEAVAQTPVEGAEPGTIVEVLQSGYRLNDLVLRPARVVVAG